MEWLGDILTVTTIVGLVLSAIARFAPNEKVYGWGTNFGKFLNGLGTSRLGAVTWEKIESFLINSIGEFLRGTKTGLNADEKIDTD